MDTMRLNLDTNASVGPMSGSVLDQVTRILNNFYWKDTGLKGASMTIITTAGNDNGNY